VDVKRVLRSASSDYVDVLKGTIHRLPSTVHKVTTPDLGRLPFLVEDAVLSDLVYTRGKYLTLRSWYPSATS
jgi:hypothetical protein